MSAIRIHKQGRNAAHGSSFILSYDFNKNLLPHLDQSLYCVQRPEIRGYFICRKEVIDVVGAES